MRGVRKSGGVPRKKWAAACIKNPPALNKKCGDALKNAPQAGILPPGMFVYTGAAVLFVAHYLGLV